MFRQLVVILVVFCFSSAGHGQTETKAPVAALTSKLASACHANVDCRAVYAELLTDKFVLRFPKDQWEIFVHADTYAFGDGKATSHAVVGVVPVSKDRFGYFPRQTSSHIVTTPRANSAFDKDDVERKTIRRAVERLMANCDKLKDCDLD